MSTLQKLWPILAAAAPFVLKGIEKWANRPKPPKPLDGARVAWNLVVVVMDGTDMTSKARVPVEEAVEFIERRTRLDINVRYVETGLTHGYATFPDAGTTKYAFLRDSYPQSFYDTLPDGTSYLFLYKLFGREPLQAGSAVALHDGLLIGGRRKPYATVPTDIWWYNNDPQGGFDNWSAQILTHEIINTIQAKVEAPPINCGQLTGTPNVPPNIHEAERLEKLTERCYELLAANPD